MKKLIQIIILAITSNIALAQSFTITPNKINAKIQPIDFSHTLYELKPFAFHQTLFSRGGVVASGIRNDVGKMRFGISRGSIGSTENFNDIVIDSTTHYVGINTSTPLAKFHVKTGTSGVTPNSEPVAFMEDNRNTYFNLAAPNANETGILFGRPDDTGTSGGIIYRSNKDMHLRTNGNVTRMTISSTGNVGIGTTTTPAAKLDINGDFIIRKKTIISTVPSIVHDFDRNGASIISTGVVTATQTITITGIAGGVDGMILYIYPSKFFVMRIENEHTGSTDINRIKTSTNSAVILSERGGVTLIYDGNDQRWHMMSF